MGAAVPRERLYGLDWLRIGAFALLILYHVGMFFVPWDWHVKTARPLEWLKLPMMAVNPWRLLLLFVISGVASRILLSKVANAGGFAISRSTRLVVPVLAGMCLFVAPQAWAELRAQGFYSGGFWAFWSENYFSFRRVHGVNLPTWNHLWFVVYLWVYTMALAALYWRSEALRLCFRGAFDRIFTGWRLLLLPIAFLAAARLLLFPQFGESHALVNDPYAHAVYGFGFFFGVGLATSVSVWEALLRQWKPALALALSGYALIVLLELTVSGEPGELELFVRRIAWSVQAWGAVVMLLAIARLHLNRETAARRYLTEAIFPYYIVHQTIIVLIGFRITPLELGPAAEFAIIVITTLIGCAVTYEVGKRICWLRPFLGLKPLSRSCAADPLFDHKRRFTFSAK